MIYSYLGFVANFWLVYLACYDDHVMVSLNNATLQGAYILIHSLPKSMEHVVLTIDQANVAIIKWRIIETDAADILLGFLQTQGWL